MLKIKFSMCMFQTLMDGAISTKIIFFILCEPVSQG